MQLALGRTPATEYLPSLSRISPYLVGKMSLMLTNQKPQEVLGYFNQFQIEDYARAGNRVKKDVIIDDGPLDGFRHTLESLLRSLGLTTILKKGIIQLLKPYTICSNGDVLTPEQAKLVKLFQRPLAQFRIKSKTHWNKNNEQVQVFDLHDDDDHNEDHEEEEEQQLTEDNDEEMIKEDQDNSFSFCFSFVVISNDFTLKSSAEKKTIIMMVLYCFELFILFININIHFEKLYSP